MVSKMEVVYGKFSTIYSICDVKKKLSDSAILHLLAPSVFNPTFERLLIRAKKYQADDKSKVYTYSENGEYKGIIVFKTEDNTAEILDIAVKPEYRRNISVVLSSQNPEGKSLWGFTYSLLTLHYSLKSLYVLHSLLAHALYRIVPKLCANSSIFFLTCNFKKTKKLLTSNRTVTIIVSDRSVTFSLGVGLCQRIQRSGYWSRRWNYLRKTGIPEPQ